MDTTLVGDVRDMPALARVPGRVLTAAVWTALCTKPALAAGTFGGFMAASTDNIYHGLSQTQGEPSLLIDGHYRGDNDLFAGLTLASVKLNPGPGTQLEVGVYAGRSVDLNPDWSVSAVLGFYSYPNAPVALPYAYTEGIARLSWRERITVSASYSPDTSRYSTLGVNRHRPAQALESLAHWPVYGPWAAFAGAGYRHFAAPIAAGYAYGSAGISFAHGRWQADLSAIGTQERAKALFGYKATESAVVLTLVWRFGADAPR